VFEVVAADVELRNRRQVVVRQRCLGRVGHGWFPFRGAAPC
jgi:hypothetical protein